MDAYAKPTSEMPALLAGLLIGYSQAGAVPSGFPRVRTA